MYAANFGCMYGVHLYGAVGCMYDSGRLLLFSAAASLALPPLLCSCCVPSLPFLLSACLLVPQASAPPWALYTVTLSRLFQFLVRLRLNLTFLGPGLVGLLVQCRLRGQGEMPGPQYARLSFLLM